MKKYTIDDIPSDFGVYEITVKKDEEAWDYYKVQSWLVMDNVQGCGAVGQGQTMEQALIDYRTQFEDHLEYFTQRGYVKDFEGDDAWIARLDKDRAAMYTKFGWTDD